MTGPFSVGADPAFQPNVALASIVPSSVMIRIEPDFNSVGSIPVAHTPPEMSATSHDPTRAQDPSERCSSQRRIPGRGEREVMETTT